MPKNRLLSAVFLLKLLGLGVWSFFLKPLYLQTESTKTPGIKIPTLPIASQVKPAVQPILFKSTEPAVEFDGRYFLTANQKLWQKNWNYQQKQQLDQNQTWLFKEFLNLLNEQQLDIIRKIPEKVLLSNFIITVKTTVDSLIKIFFNRNPNNSAYLQLEQLLKLVKKGHNALKDQQFKITDDFKTRFATNNLASNEFAKHLKQLFHVDDGTATYQTKTAIIQAELIKELDNLKKETLFSRQKVILNQLFAVYPTWFKGTDEIDLADSWNQKWEGEGGAKKIKINQLVNALAKKTATLDAIVAALKLHVEDTKPLVVKLSTNKKILLTYNATLFSGSIYNPIVYIEPNNPLLIQGWISLIADFLRYCFLKAQLSSPDSVLDATWDLKQLNETWSNEITETLYQTLNKILLHFRVKKVAIPSYFNAPPSGQNALTIDQIGNIFTGTFSFVKNNFLEGELKKVVKNVPTELKKNLSNILKYLKAGRKFIFPSWLDLEPKDYQTLLDNSLQTRIKKVLQTNHSQLLTLHNQMMKKTTLQTTYFNKYKTENFLLQKYQPAPEAEKKYLLSLNLYDQTTFQDYRLLVKYAENKWKIVYCDHSFARQQWNEFLKAYRGHEIVKKEQLRYKFSALKASKDKIQLIKIYQIRLPEQFNLQGQDFNQQSEITETKLNDNQFTNEQRYLVMNNLDLTVLDEVVYTEIIKKLLLIKAKENSLNSKEKIIFQQFLEESGIDKKVINNDDYRTYSFTQLNNIFKFKITEFEKRQRLETLKLLLARKKEIVKIAKLVPLDILKDTKVTLNDLDINANLSAAKTAELTTSGLTTAEFEAIKLSLNNAITVELPNQSAAVRKALMYTSLFEQLQTEFQTQTSKWTRFLTALGIRLSSDVDTVFKIYARMQNLSPNAVKNLETYAGLKALNHLIKMNPVANWNTYQYAFFAYNDIKSFYQKYGDYWWFNQNNLGTAIQYLILPSNNQSKRFGIEGYDQTILTLNDITFLQRLYQTYTFNQDGVVKFNDSYRLMYLDSYYYRTWDNWNESGN